MTQVTSALKNTSYLCWHPRSNEVQICSVNLRAQLRSVSDAFVTLLYGPVGGPVGGPERSHPDVLKGSVEGPEKRKIFGHEWPIAKLWNWLHEDLKFAKSVLNFKSFEKQLFLRDFYKRCIYLSSWLDIP